MVKVAATKRYLQICHKEYEKNTVPDIVMKSHNIFSFSQTVEELITIHQKGNTARAGGKQGVTS